VSADGFLRAFGGSPLRGDSFVRWAYVDEAGVSAREPIVTVAGLVIHADKHHRLIKNRLDALLAELPSELAEDLIFHAKDIWHGNGQFARAKWEAHGIYKDERRSLVTKLCSLPAEFDVPVVMGFVVKGHHDWTAMVNSRSGLNANRASYAIAFGQCCIAIEAFMRERAQEDEVAHIVAEDTKEMREHASWSYEVLEKREGWGERFGKYLPIERLAEDPMFAAKRRSSILQVADSIAFVTNRHVTHYRDNKSTDASDVLECWNAFAPQVFYPWGLSGSGRSSPFFSV
jgi:hypothetical protein